MPIADIKRQLCALKSYYQSEVPSSLNDRVEAALAEDAWLQLKDIFDASSPSIADLTAFLTANWDVTKGTMACVTAKPESLLSVLLCDVAEWAVAGTTISPISLIMPTVELESIRDDYPHLSDMPLKRILNTHILGDDHQHLIPIRLLTELDLSPKPELIRMPYVHAGRFSDDAAYTITSNEYKRLIEHTALTKSLAEARNEYLVLAGDTSHLLGQLQRLCSQLAMNSAFGVGSETHAGTAVYPAIIHFMTYYDHLGADVQSRLPRVLKENIDTLLGYVSDPTKNMDATKQIETCIADRRVKLMGAMAGHEVFLSQISLSRASKEPLIHDAVARFEIAKNHLVRAIASGDYGDGHDKLSMTLALLDAFDIQLSIASLADLACIQALSSSEIRDVLQNAALRDQILNTIANLENLVVFIIETAPEKITPFLDGLSHELSNTLVCTSRDLSALLISLDIEKCNFVCRALSSVITDAFDVSQVLKYISPDQRTVLFDTIKYILPDLIKSAYDVARVLQYLTADQRIVVFDAIKNMLPDLLQSGYDVRFVLDFLTPEQRTVVLDVKKIEALFLNDPTVLSDIAPYLSHSQFACLFTRLVVQDCRWVAVSNWPWLIDIMANPWAEGTAAVLMMLGTAAAIIQDPMTVIQTAMATTAVVSTVVFFLPKKPDNKLEEMSPEIRPAG